VIEEGIVSERGVTEKGTPKIKAGAYWYYAGRGVDFASDIVGKKILIEYELFGDRKNLRSAKSWSLAPHQPGAAEVAQNGLSKGVPTFPLPQPITVPHDPNALSERESMAVSNWVRGLIDTQQIKLEELDMAVAKCVHALRHWGDWIP